MRRREDVVRSIPAGGRRTEPPAVRDRLVDVHEAAGLLGLKPGTLYQWAYQRRLPVVKLFGRPRGPLRFRLSDIERLIAKSVRPAIRDSLVDPG